MTSRRPAWALALALAACSGGSEPREERVGGAFLADLQAQPSFWLERSTATGARYVLLTDGEERVRIRLR